MLNNSLISISRGGYRLHLVYTFFSIFVLLFILSSNFVYADDINVSDGNADFSFNAFIRDADVIDGTAEWDPNDEAGNDSGPTNGIVRTFDTVTYPVKVTINSKNGQTLRNIKIRLTGTLHDGFKDGRAIGDFAIGNKTEMTDAKNGKVSFTQDYTIRQSGNAVMIPVTINVQGAKPDQYVYPDYIKVDVVSIDDKAVSDVSVTFNQLKKIKVSAKVSLGVKAATAFGYSAERIPYYRFNRTLELGDKREMQRMNYSIMVIPIAGKNSIKGATFPTGKIYFKIVSSGAVNYDNHRELNRSLNPETEVPTLFDYHNIGIPDGMFSGHKNTLSYSLGQYNSFYSDIGLGVAKSNYKYAGNPPLNAVWDSGVYTIDKDYIADATHVYEGHIENYTIGNIFPIYQYDNDSRRGATYSANQKAFSTQAFLFLNNNHFAYKNSNNPYEINNNQESYHRLVVTAYEDENGNKIPLNAEATAVTSARNEFGSGFDATVRIKNIDGSELGTPNPLWTIIPQGDEAIFRNQNVRTDGGYYRPGRMDGGLKYLCKWNIDSFYLDKSFANNAQSDALNYWFLDSRLNSVRLDSDHLKIYYGVPKDKDMSFSKLGSYSFDDYRWYTFDQFDQALNDGEIGAYMLDIQSDLASYGWRGIPSLPLHVKTSKFGSLSEKGTPNVLMTEYEVFPKADRSQSFYYREGYGNPTYYDEKGNITRLQNPVKGTVAFDTLAILNAKTSTSIQFDKSTYYISDTPKVTLKSTVSFDDRSSESISDTDMHLKNVLDAPFVYKKNSAYYEKDGKRVYVEPKMTRLTENRSLLEWTYMINAKDKSVPDIHYEVTINPLYLGSGVAVSNGIRSIIESDIDRRGESLRSFSASVTLLKIGQVGVAESIEKDFGEKNSDYTIHLQPYTTIEDEAGVKGITHVPQNNDKYGSKFHGSTYLKNVVVNSTKELLLYVNKQNIEVSDPNQVDVRSNGWMSYEDAKAQGILDEVKTIYFVIPGVLSNKDQPTIDLTFGTKDNQFHDIYYNEVLANSNTHYPVSPVSNRVSYQIKAQLELALRKIQVYTDLASKGLPVSLYLNKEVVQTAGNEQTYTLNLYQKDSGQKVASKTLKGSDDVSVIKLTIPKEYLTKNAHHEYEVRIEDYDNRYAYVDDAVKKVSTEGYTSAETTIHTVDESLNYKGVVMTEREVGFDMVTYYESVKVPVSALKKTKTGYGYALPNYSVKYYNELGYSNTELFISFNPQLVLPHTLVDRTLNVNNEANSVDLSLHLQGVNTDTQNNKTFVYELPEVSIHKGDGLTYLKEDVLKLSETQQKAYIDGGRKLYIPVWLKHLGNYPIHFGGDSRIGVNQVKLDVEQTLNVYAYMYATDYSNTISKDEVMMKPELNQ